MRPNTIHSEKEFAKITSASLDKLRNTLKQASQKHLKSMHGKLDCSNSRGRKTMQLSKRITPILLTLLLAISIITVSIKTSTVSSQTTSQSTIVSTELINFYGMTTSEVQNFVSTIDNQGIPLLIVRLNAMNEFRSGTSSGISKAKQVIQEANSRGIQVAIDMHTWYTTWDSYFRDSASNSAGYRSQYITYVRNVIDAFAGSNVYAFMVMNEPQARAASNSENQFILDVIGAAKQETSSPVSVRFMAGYSPSTGHYSSQIDQACDFLCRNTYWDPRSPGTTVYGATQAKLQTAINTAHSQGKALWITEFGKTKSNLESQRAYVEAFVSWAKSNGVDAVFCWVCQPESGSGETYNIFNGYSPNPAFYELVNDGAPLPTPTPTPQPTTNHTPTPQPTPTSQPVQPSTAIVQDGFESGTFNAWTSTSSTSGETADVVGSSAYEGAYSAGFTSNGQGRYEKTYAYESVSPAADQIYIRGQFRLTQNGMQQADDRVKLIELRAGSRIVAAAGVWWDGGDLCWWMETRDGSAYVETCTAPVAVDVADWFSVQLGWVSDGQSGGGSLWVNGALVYSIGDADTNNYGGCSEVQVGLAEAYNCASMAVQVDNAVIATSFISALPVTPPTPTPTPTPEPTTTTTPTPTPSPSPPPTPEPSPTQTYTGYRHSDRHYRR